MNPLNENLSPVEAAAAIGEMERVADIVQARIHGLTWMFWGIVAPAIFVTYSYAASYEARSLAETAHGVPAWFGLLWLPWSAVGLAFTVFLWRSVGFVSPGRAIRAREIAIHALLVVSATIGLVIVGFKIGEVLYPPTIVLTGIGLVTAMLGARAAFARGPMDGVVQVVIGLLLIAFAVMEAFILAGPLTLTGLSQAALWNAFASAVGLGGLGLYRILRS